MSYSKRTLRLASVFLFVAALAGCGAESGSQFAMDADNAQERTSDDRRLQESKDPLPLPSEPAQAGSGDEPATLMLSDVDPERSPTTDQKEPQPITEEPKP